MRTFFIFGIMFFSLEGLYAKEPLFSDAIYKNDDRKLISSFSRKNIREFSKSVGILIDKSLLKKIDVNFFEVESLSQTDQNGLNICIDQKFSNLKSLNACSGFLSGPDEFITAGHCFLNQNDCNEKVIIFDYKKPIFGTKIKISKDNIHECQSIEKQLFDPDVDYDYAKIKLKSLSNRKALTLSKTMHNPNHSHAMIGFPLGQPMTVSTDVEIIGSNEDTLSVRVDSFQGNSGSPLIDLDTGKVVGILSRGQEDFVYNEDRLCHEHNIIVDQKSSETFTRSQLLY